MLHQIEEGHNLDRQCLAKLKAFRLEHNFANIGDIGRHHGNWTELGLQVIGQLRTAGIAGIHSDEHRHAFLDGDNLSLEGEAGEVIRVVLLQSIIDLMHLLSNHTQDFHLNTIELVETAPTACLHQSTEHTAEIFVIQTI